MPHYLGTHNSKPNAAQKAQLTKALKAIDADLTLCIGTQPGEAAMYVEAPDAYGASHMIEKRQAVREAVKSVMA